MVNASRFWDRHAKGYAKRPVADEASYQHKLELTRERLTPEMDVLELGCGTGSTALVHAPYVRHIIAVDISAKMLEIARQKAKTSGIANVSFEQSSVEDFEAPDGRYDVVMVHSLLHLLEDRENAIAKIHRWLKPGGLLVSSTPCLAGKYQWLRPILPLGRLFGLLPRVEFLSAETLEDELGAAGFSIAHRWRPDSGIAVFHIASKMAASEAIREPARASA